MSASEIPRRIDTLRYVPAERAIRAAMQAVEEMSADERLTKAVILLGDAQSWVADYVDGVKPEDHYPRPATQAAEPTYPCDDCGKLRTKAEGGTTFTVCEECWEKHYPRAAPEDGERP